MEIFNDVEELSNAQFETNVKQASMKNVAMNDTTPNKSEKSGMSGSNSTMTNNTNVTSTISSSQECAGCGKSINERFLLRALDLFWHEDCLKCGCCDCRLGEVGSTLYTKANLILCKRDYLRLFGNTGYCAACNKVIPAFEMVMRARNNVYHLECFACQQCNHRFCVGDRFYLCENKILCEYDYEERLVFANMAYNPNTLPHIKRQISHLPPPPPISSIQNINGNAARGAVQHCDAPDRRGANHHHSNEMNGMNGLNGYANGNTSSSSIEGAGSK